MIATSSHAWTEQTAVLRTRNSALSDQMSDVIFTIIANSSLALVRLIPKVVVPVSKVWLAIQTITVNFSHARRHALSMSSNAPTVASYTAIPTTTVNSLRAARSVLTTKDAVRVGFIRNGIRTTTANFLLALMYAPLIFIDAQMAIGLVAILKIIVDSIHVSKKFVRRIHEFAEVINPALVVILRWVASSVTRTVTMSANRMSNIAQMERVCFVIRTITVNIQAALQTAIATWALRLLVEMVEKLVLAPTAIQGVKTFSPVFQISESATTEAYVTEIHSTVAS
mmetsp:Transcript_16858/g.24948  ORF Transcript_16858/g.24948 Transcript_16858/m.24948 type:complete len:283 (+) Transcript_16858:1806-2654(+)